MDFKLMSTALTSKASLMVPELEGLPRGTALEGQEVRRQGKGRV